MEKDIVLERLLDSEEYKAFKEESKAITKVLFPITVFFVAFSVIAAIKDFFDLGNIVIYLWTYGMFVELKKNVKAAFFQISPYQYSVSVIKKIRGIRKKNNRYIYTATEYLVSLEGNDVWAESFGKYRKSSGYIYDDSKLQVGHSVIVFKLSPNSSCYIVSNE